MSLAFFFLILLPGVALAGPLLVGITFDADWVLRAGLGFDACAVVLGIAASWFVRSDWVATDAGPSLGTSLATALGIGLVGFGLLFGALSTWWLFRET